jgi:hypothetical protein
MCTLNPIGQTIFQTTEIAEANKEGESPAINFAQHVPVGTALPEKCWHERAIAQLKTYQHRLDELIPNNIVQDHIDALGRTIKETFAPLAEFNRMLDSAVSGPWYKQLALFLVKLPIRSARNIVNLLYVVVKSALYAAVHPLKAVLKLAKFLVLLVNELSKPETWAKIGVGMISAGLAQSLVTGNAISLIGIAIGLAMAIGGITASCLKAALEAEEGERAEAIKDKLLATAQELAESALTGFCLGLIMGAIERAHQRIHDTYRVSNVDEAKQYVDRLIKEHKLPPYDNLVVDRLGSIRVVWSKHHTETIGGVNMPFIIGGEDGSSVFSGLGRIRPHDMCYVDVSLNSPTNTSALAWVRYHDEGVCKMILGAKSLRALGIPGDRLYPLPPNTLPYNIMNNVGQVIGASQALYTTVQKIDQRVL